MLHLEETLKTTPDMPDSSSEDLPQADHEGRSAGYQVRVMVAFDRVPTSSEAKEAVEGLREDAGLDLKEYPGQVVGAKVLQRHPVLADLGGITWATLQFIESEVILRTMLRLKRGHAIPALPVHDSLIVPKEAWWVAGRVLLEKLEAATGYPPLVPKLTPPMSKLPGPLHTRYADLLSRYSRVLPEAKRGLLGGSPDEHLDEVDLLDP